ncbi:hypothetical protein HDU86_003850 [Geranomyces michiganensis]|nr:hypothetical protein HDU86_003850 [Geranomyces michiganensis]
MRHHNTLSLLLLLLLALVVVTQSVFAAPAIAARQANGNCKEVQVQDKDTCSVIATRNGIELAKFMDYNPGINCNTLRANQWVCVSAGARPNHRPTSKGLMCAVHQVVDGSSCSAIASEFDLTVPLIEFYNRNTFRWEGCGKLQKNSKICLSFGFPPKPPPDPRVDCGQESTKGSKCPLNVCCGKWGFCGQTEEFCTAFPNKAPGVGCQSNCGMEAPASSKVCTDTMKYTVGYYSSWAAKRKCQPWVPEDINPNQWTHIHYAFTVVSASGRLDVENGDYDLLKRLVKMKEGSAMKVVVSVGGWSFQNPGPTVDRFKNMASSSASRATFIQSALDMFKTYGVDGLDIDWEYPTTPERSGSPSDTKNYSLLLKELHAAFNGQYTLSIATPAGYWYLRHFELEEIVKYLDYIVYMTYDLHGNWDAGIKSLGPTLNAHTNMTEISSVIVMMQKAGVPSNKIVMGLGFYGRSFLMTDPSCHTAGKCTFQDPGSVDPTTDNYVNVAAPGPCTDAGGYLAYYEIMGAKARNMITHYRDEKAMSEIMVYNTNNWIAYDSPDTLHMKIAAAREKCLGGVVVWAIDLDDNVGTLANAITGAGLGQSSIDFAFLDEFIKRIKSATELWDGFFEDMMDVVVPQVTKKKYNQRQGAKCMIYAINAMVARLVDLIEGRLTNNVIAGDKSGFQDKLDEITLGKGRNLFSCKENFNNKAMDCPSALYKKGDKPVWINWSTDKVNDYQKLAAEANIDPDNLEFTERKFTGRKTCLGDIITRRSYPGEEMLTVDPGAHVAVNTTDLIRRDSPGAVCNYALEWHWKNYPTVKINDGTTTNDYGEYAYGLYKEAAQKRANEHFKDHMFKDMLPFFDCSPGPCPTGINKNNAAEYKITLRDKDGLNNYLGDKVGMGEEGYSLDGEYSEIGNFPGDSSRMCRELNKCKPPVGGFKLKGSPQVKKEWPVNPSGHINDYLKNAKEITGGLDAIIKKTDVTGEELRVRLEQLTYQAGTGDSIYKEMKNYEAAAEKAVKEAEAAKRSFIETLISIVVGVVVSALLPGAGAALMSAAFAGARAAALVGNIAADSASFARVMATWGPRAANIGSNIAKFSAQVFENLPKFMQQIVSKAKNAFLRLKPAAVCMVGEVAADQISGAITDAIFAGVKVTRRSLLTIDPPSDDLKSVSVFDGMFRGRLSIHNMPTIDELRAIHAIKRGALAANNETIPPLVADHHWVHLEARGGKRPLPETDCLLTVGQPPKEKEFRDKIGTRSSQFQRGCFESKSIPTFQPPGWKPGDAVDQDITKWVLTDVDYHFDTDKDEEASTRTKNIAAYTKDYRPLGFTPGPTANMHLLECDHSLEVAEVKNVLAWAAFDKVGVSAAELCKTWSAADVNGHDSTLSNIQDCMSSKNNMRMVPAGFNQIKQGGINNGGFGIMKSGVGFPTEKDLTGTMVTWASPYITTKRKTTAQCIQTELRSRAQTLKASNDKAAQSLGDLLNDKANDVETMERNNHFAARDNIRARIEKDKDKATLDKIKTAEEKAFPGTLKENADYKQQKYVSPQTPGDFIKKYPGLDDKKFYKSGEAPKPTPDKNPGTGGGPNGTPQPGNNSPTNPANTPFGDPGKSRADMGKAGGTGC